MALGCRAYSRPLLGATMAPILEPWIFKKIFTLETVTNGICLRGESKQTTLFFEKCAPKNAPMAPMSRIGSGLIYEIQVA